MGVAALVVATGVVAGVGLLASGSDDRQVAVGGGAGPSVERDPALASAADPAASSVADAEPAVEPSGFVILNDTELTWLDEAGRPTDALLADPQFQPRSYAGSDSPRLADGGDGSLLYTYVDGEPPTPDEVSMWSDDGPRPGDSIGTPTLRRIDQSGESTVASGAATFGVLGDGRLAYVRGVRPEVRSGEPYLGEVVVSDVHGEPEVWSPHAGEWEIHDVAGEYVIAFESRGEDAHSSGWQNWVLSGDDARPIGERAVLATDASGSRILVSELIGDPLEDERIGATVRMIDLATLDEIAAWRVPDFAGLGLNYFGGPRGSWVGDYVALPSSPGVIVLDVGGSEITFVGRLPIEGDQEAWGVQAEVVDQSPTVLTVVANNDYDDRAGAWIGTAQRCTLTKCEVIAEQTARRFNLEVDEVPNVLGGDPAQTGQ